MSKPARRLERERRTVSLMIAMYCRAQHAPAQGLCAQEVCAECAELQAYALERVEKCRFGAEKPACANCPVHCYKPDMRARIREVMRPGVRQTVLR